MTVAPRPPSPPPLAGPGGAVDAVADGRSGAAPDASVGPGQVLEHLDPFVVAVGDVHLALGAGGTPRGLSNCPLPCRRPHFVTNVPVEVNFWTRFPKASTT